MDIDWLFQRYVRTEFICMTVDTDPALLSVTDYRVVKYVP